MLFIFLFSCGSSKRASYYYSQKLVDEGSIGSQLNLRVDEYLNAFDQPEVRSPTKGEVNLQVDYFYDSLPNEQKTVIAQVAIRTRKASSKERSQKIALSIALDISGSMAGELLKDSKNALIESVKELPLGSEYTLVVFDDQADVFIPKVTITRKSKKEIIGKISSLETRGGTNIQAGLIQGYQQLAKLDPHAISRLILITDGQSNVGTTHPKEIAKRASVPYREGARISTIGLGVGVEEHTLRKIAEEGLGHYYYSNNATQLTKILREDLSSTLIPVVKKPQINLTASKDFKIKNIYGFESYLNSPSIKIPFSELNADDWRILMVEIEKVTPKNKGDVRPLRVKFEYQNMQQKQFLISSAPAINWSSSKKNSLNKAVARNSVIFSNVLALKKIASLYVEGSYSQAMDLADLQLTNIRIVKQWDADPQWNNEEKKFIKLRKKLNRQTPPAEKSTPHLHTVKSTKSSSTVRELVKGGLGLATKIVPGPWGLIISLFELML